MRLSFKCFIFVFTILCFACQTNASDKPNIIFILADDLGRNDISFYGHGKNGLRTPHIDRIFREGVSFNNFYANSPVCSPTRAALMTGLYPDHAGVPGVIRQVQADSWGYLRHDVSLLPAQLQKLGYDTNMVGKWHLGYDSPNIPNDRGFDQFHGFLGDMMDDYFTHLRGGQNWMRLNRDEIKPEGHATDLFTDWAVDVVKQRAKSEKPFFLYLAYNAPHTPIQPGQGWLERVQAREPGLNETRAALVALIEQMDAGIGRVLDAVSHAGIENETLIVFSSDNGGQLNVGADNGPWRGTKGETFEGGIRVVCGARWQGVIPAGLKANISAASFDWYPTLCEIAGADQEMMKTDAQSLKRVLLNPSDSAQFQDREIYFVRREGGPNYAGKTIEGLRRGQWKLVMNTPFEMSQLFDLANDPNETTDLSTRNQPKKREMIKHLQLHLQRGGAIPWQSPQAESREPK